MSQSSKNKKFADVNPTRWILIALIAVTLYFQTTLADPFNSPKFWILLLISAWLLGHILMSRKIIFSEKTIKNVFYLTFTFVVCAILSTISADFWYPAVFGETQRRNGLLSYISLSIMLIASAIYVRLFNVKKVFFTTFFISSIFVIYAFMQTSGNDFANWDNPYNSLIGTVGNPNFAAALMAVMGIIIFSTIFIDEFDRKLRIYAPVLSLALLVAIYRSNARQGLLSYFIGLGLFLIIWLWVKNKKYGILAAVAGVLIFIFSILGMLQIGPFEKYLYKPSVTVRGYYWRAGIEMFSHHPLFGVGMDRYGAFFKQYRDVNYSLAYGFDLTSTNAHNTFIQFFATGGIFLGLSYLVLNMYVLKTAITGIRDLSGNGRLIISGIFSAWVAFHAQSLVSIDNLGISIWGWLLGGSIIGLSVSGKQDMNKRPEYFLKQQSNLNIIQPVASGFTTLIVAILVIFLYRGEVNSYNANQSVNYQDATTREIYRDAQLKVIDSKLNDPSYKLFSASKLVQAGFVNEGLKVAQKLYAENSRNLDILLFLSIVNEQTNQISAAITYREKIAELDPWNAANFLALGNNYKANGELDKSKVVLKKILSFAPQTQIAQQAKIDLG